MKRYTLLCLVALFSITTHVFAGEINRAQFTAQITDREPVDQLVSIPDEMQKIYYFTELLNFKGEKVTHQWTYQGQEMYRLTFDVKGPRWRVWSSKRLLPKLNGSWTVNILDANDQVIHSNSFEYLP